VTRGAISQGGVKEISIRKMLRTKREKSNFAHIWGRRTFQVGKKQNKTASSKALRHA
jgi:hypothetical protein